MIHAIIMAGGAGTRFWPASRNLRPKQLLNLAGERTMIQATVDRLQGLVPDDRILVVTNRALVAPIREQVPQLPPEAFLGRALQARYGACIGLAAFLLSLRDEEATMLVLPADQLIHPRDKFHAVVHQASHLVEQHPRRIVTFGNSGRPIPLSPSATSSGRTAPSWAGSGQLAGLSRAYVP